MVPACMFVTKKKKGSQDYNSEWSRLRRSRILANCPLKQFLGSSAVWGDGQSACRFLTDCWEPLSQLCLPPRTGRSLFCGLCSVTETWTPRQAPTRGLCPNALMRCETEVLSIGLSHFPEARLGLAAKPGEQHPFSYLPSPWSRAKMRWCLMSQNRRKTKASPGWETYGRN